MIDDKGLLDKLYQEEHSDRKNLKQDFTPRELAELISELDDVEESAEILDVCAGIGNLTVQITKKKQNSNITAVELSKRAIPFLLLNLAMQNVNATVINGNFLTGENYKIYKLEKTKAYSDITEVDQVPEKKYDLIISNPPFSLKAEEYNENLFDRKYKEIIPSQRADFLFILIMLEKLKENGKIYCILPHGILFRGNNEKEIRKQLLLDSNIAAVIGLPEKMFLNTAIPTIILALSKKKIDEKVLFIDASNCYIKNAKYNVLTNIKEIVGTFRSREEKEKFSHLATSEEIIENDYNLNIPRYISNVEEEELPPLKELLEDIKKINKEIKETEYKVFDTMFKEMNGFSGEEYKLIEEIRDGLF